MRSDNMRLDLERGTYLVKSAREVIEEYLDPRKSMIDSASIEDGLLGKARLHTGYPELKEPGGVFCTLRVFPSQELRGCIGLLYPDSPLDEATVRAAIDSTQDPRFPPLAQEELGSITIELSVLDGLEELEGQTPEERLGHITPGRDGLVLRYKEPGSGILIGQGLLLPQVWERMPDKETFLSNLCYKAGIEDPNAWKAPNTELLRFQIQIFEESGPGGEIEEKVL